MYTTSISHRNNFLPPIVNFKLPRLNISINIPRTFFSPLKILDSKSMKSLAFHSRPNPLFVKLPNYGILPVQRLSLADHRCISIDRWFSRAKWRIVTIGSRERRYPPWLALPKGKLAARNSALRNRRIEGTVSERERERENAPRRAVCTDETARRHRRCTCCNNVPGLIHRRLSASSDSYWSPVQNQPRARALHHTLACTYVRARALSRTNQHLAEPTALRSWECFHEQRTKIRSDGGKKREELETVKSVGKRLAICAFLEWFMRSSPIGKMKFKFSVETINLMTNYSAIM